MDTPSGSTDGRTGKERRRHRRYAMAMRIAGVRLTECGGPSDRSQVLSLDVKDISNGGLCGFVAEQVSCDEDLMLHIPPLGARGGRDVRGLVTRCRPVDGGYVLGLTFRDPLEEAAQHLH